MAGEAFVGGEAKFYYNTGTYGSPTWTLIDNVQDLDVADARASVPVPIRGNWPLILDLIGGRSIVLTWGMVQKQETTDAALTALIANYEAGTPTEFAIADQAIATVGCKYQRMICIITKNDQSQPIEGVCTHSFEAKPHFNNGGNNPSRVTVAS